jgi:hypothetical protein
VANQLATVANRLLSAVFQPLSAYNVAQESMTILTRWSSALRLAGYLKDRPLTKRVSQFSKIQN